MKLSELRQLVSIEQVLEQRGLMDGLRLRGQRLVGPCPLHGGDNPTAFAADITRGLWICHTRCGGGDIVELLRRLDGVSYAEVARTLSISAHRLPIASPQPPASSHFRPYTRRLSLDPEHPFLGSRRITVATARRFEAGAWHGDGMLRGCIAVRLHDLNGQPIGYAGRRLQPDDRGKWVAPRALPKSQLLYGWHRQPRPGPLIVVEGPWDAMRLDQLGLGAVALLGLTASRPQLHLLSTRSCLVLLDGDDAGRRAADRLAQDLQAPAIDLPDGADPADLTDSQLGTALQPFLSSNQPA